jgi:asparagine synthase (glutamine-hydrolysing)
MCGIGAIINGNTSQLNQLMRRIRHRGESFNEHVIVGDVALSCNRLKIVDRINATQPLTNESKTVFAVLNGEIYNHDELRERLKKKGHIFQTISDTEVLTHGYEEWGNDLPKKLDGQFAFVVYDKNRSSYLAARDHYGIKPLYSANYGKTVYFASELKQLVPFVDEVQEVLPGHYATNGGIEPYYTLPDKLVEDDVDSIAKTVNELLHEAVRKRVQTDLPLAVFFSGGLDSALVLAIARKYHKDITAFCVGKADWESKDSDLYIAKRYCEENGIRLIEIPSPTEEELFSQVPELVKVSESFEPNMVKGSTLSLYVSGVVKSLGFKVALCGEGADELFAGYPEFANQEPEVIHSLSREFFHNLYRTQLQRVDKSAMKHTLEMRVPFLDVALAEYSLNIPAHLKVSGNFTKCILRKAFEGELPDYILQRQKTVFIEGAGHKGNSLQDGMFAALAASQVSGSELDFLSERFPEYGITTKEEALYVKHYVALGYNKAIFPGRPPVNRMHTKLSE